MEKKIRMSFLKSKSINIRSDLITILIFVVVALITTNIGCGAYFNTFFNAKQSFNKAEAARKRSSRGLGNAAEYRKAIDKALKVVEEYPNSKYYDDALYVLAVSYFHTRQYSKSVRRFREILIDYEDSEYAVQSRLYLAKGKLELGDIADAMKLFTEIFDSDIEREIKGEAAMALGTYHYEQRENSVARQYFRAVRDSLGTQDDKLYAQMLIADGQFEDFRFADALGSYLQVLGMDPPKNDLYHALFHAADCSFRLQRMIDGFDYLQELIDDEVYFDSLTALKMKLAEGYELEDELEESENVYLDIIKTSENKKQIAEANYQLGLIYQFDYDLLDEAKEYYDNCVAASRGALVSRDAIKRSADIGKRERYARAVLDTAATPELIDVAAETQFQLAQLYWFELNKPDTAIIEMQYLIDSFPTADNAPRAAIALSQMYRDHLSDNATADSLLRSIVINYRKSDYVSEAVELLGLSGTAVDTGYARYHLYKAENFLLDDKYIDSAKIQYQHIVDNFPDSKYYLQARFNLLWILENHEHPGDSTVIFAYLEFLDSFPGTPEALEIKKILGGAAFVARDDQQDTLFGNDIEGEPDNSQSDVISEIEKRERDFGQEASSEIDSTSGTFIDPAISLYRSPDFPDDPEATIPEIKAEPTQVTRPFEYPIEALNITQEETFFLNYQILLDFFGKVIDFRLKNGSPVEELNNRANDAIRTSTFDSLEMNRIISTNMHQPDVTNSGYWFVYKFEVTKPEHLR